MNCKHDTSCYTRFHVHVMIMYVALDLKGLPTDYSRHCTYNGTDWRSNERVSIPELWLLIMLDRRSMNGSISMNSRKRNLRRSYLWLIMNPGRRSYETGQYYGNFRQCSPDQCTRILSCSVNKMESICLAWS